MYIYAYIYTQIYIYIYIYIIYIHIYTPVYIWCILVKHTRPQRSETCKHQTRVEVTLGILRGIDSISSGASCSQALDESLTECDGVWSEVNRPIQAEPLDAEFPCQSTWRWTDELQFGNHSHDALLNVEECRPSSTFSPKLRTDGRDGTWMSRRMPICARCSGCLKTEAGAASKISCESTATSGGINQCGTAKLEQHRIWCSLVRIDGATNGFLCAYMIIMVGKGLL